MILGIDPGPHESAYCGIEDYDVFFAEKADIGEVLSYIVDKASAIDHVAIESIQCYGIAVGKETFETCYNIGRLIQKCEDFGIGYTLYPRPEYMRSILGAKAPKGKADSMLWQALQMRFGGSKKGEPLHLLKGASDKRSAYAVAVYHLDLNKRPT